MSYILDALKRAHAERTHAPPAGSTLSGTQAFTLPSATGGRRLPGILVLGSVSLILVAALATWWLRSDRTPAQAAIPPSVVAAAPASSAPVVSASAPGAAPLDNAPPASPKPFVGPTQAAAPVLRPPPMPANTADRGQDPAPTPAQSAARSAALMPIQGRPVGPGDATSPAPPAEGSGESTGTMAPGAPAAPGAGVPAAPPPMPVTSPAPAPATPAPLPATRTTTTTSQGAPSSTLAGDAGLKVTGATYSENPAHRLLIVNGKVVKEGQEVEPGLVLEVIAPRSAVFKRQGTRFNVNY